MQNEPNLGFLLLSLAGLGASATWLAGLSAASPTRCRILRTVAAARSRLVRISDRGIRIHPVHQCDVGRDFRPGDPNSANIGGLIPFSDAANYLTAAFDQVKDGIWNTLALRRPLAAAFRSDLLFLARLFAAERC